MNPLTIAAAGLGAIAGAAITAASHKLTTALQPPDSPYCHGTRHPHTWQAWRVIREDHTTYMARTCERCGQTTMTTGQDHTHP